MRKLWTHLSTTHLLLWVSFSSPVKWIDNSANTVGSL